MEVIIHHNQEGMELVYDRFLCSGLKVKIASRRRVIYLNENHMSVLQYQDIMRTIISYDFDIVLQPAYVYNDDEKALSADPLTLIIDTNSNVLQFSRPQICFSELHTISNYFAAHID